MLSELMAVDDGLSDWAVRFIDSIARQRRAGRTLSSSQGEKLEEVWDDRF